MTFLYDRKIKKGVEIELDLLLLPGQFLYFDTTDDDVGQDNGTGQTIASRHSTGPRTDHLDSRRWQVSDQAGQTCSEGAPSFPL